MIFFKDIKNKIHKKIVKLIISFFLLMQHKILNFINRFNDIVVENGYLNRILHEFHFSFVWNFNQIDIDIFQNPNKKAIIAVDEYQENNEKYYFICYEYNFIIVKDPPEYKLHDLRFFFLY